MYIYICKIKVRITKILRCIKTIQLVDSETLYIFYVFTFNKVLMHFKLLVVLAFILHISLNLCKATSLCRLFTIIFYWSKATFTVYLKNYKYIYMTQAEGEPKYFLFLSDQIICVKR